MLIRLWINHNAPFPQPLQHTLYKIYINNIIDYYEQDTAKLFSKK